MTDDELTRKAQDLGLGDLAEKHSADLRKGLENGMTLAAKLPVDLHWSEEAAHTFNRAPRRPGPEVAS